MNKLSKTATEIENIGGPPAGKCGCEYRGAFQAIRAHVTALEAENNRANLRIDKLLSVLAMILPKESLLLRDVLVIDDKLKEGE